MLEYCQQSELLLYVQAAFFYRLMVDVNHCIFPGWLQPALFITPELTKQFKLHPKRFVSGLKMLPTNLKLWYFLVWIYQYPAKKCFYTLFPFDFKMASPPLYFFILNFSQFSQKFQVLFKCLVRCWPYLGEVLKWRALIEGYHCTYKKPV